MPTRKKQIVAIKLEEGAEIKYTLYPKTQDEIKKAVKKVRSKAGVRASYDLAVVEAAFIAAGIQRARELNVKAVRPRHIWQGYDKHFRISMEHYTFQCVPRSVLMRIEKLKDESPIFRNLVANIDE